MANLNTYQATKIAELSGATFKEYDDAVKYYWSRVLSTPKTYPTFMFRYGMPQEYAEGKYGYEIIGLSGMHVLPEPDPFTHRVSFRYGAAPNYLQKYGNFFRFVVPMTDFPKNRELKYKDPKHALNNMLRSMAQTYPLYLKYLSWNMLKGKNKQLSQVDPILNGWVGKFIEPSDGAQNGYQFYLSEGYGEINLNKVIDKKKVTEHPLKNALKLINDELTKESKKVEYDFSTDQSNFKDKKLLKDNIMDTRVKKFIGLCMEIRRTINKILEAGCFPDVKYKVKNDANHWEGILPPISGASDLVLVLPSSTVQLWDDQKLFLTPGKIEFEVSSSWFKGVEVVTSSALDDNTAYLVTRDLIQCWFMPVLSRNLIEPYRNEETIDYKSEFGHSLDLINIHCNIYFTTKA